MAKKIKHQDIIEANPYGKYGQEMTKEGHQTIGQKFPKTKHQKLKGRYRKVYESGLWKEKKSKKAGKTVRSQALPRDVMARHHYDDEGRLKMAGEGSNKPQKITQKRKYHNNSYKEGE
jgi:hypothetical protein